MAQTAPQRLTPRAELLALQKKIFQRNERIIRTEAIVEEPGFALYERRYKKQVADFDRIARIEDVVRGIETADIIYLGDYHTNPQSQRTLLRILKLVTGKVPGLTLCLELVKDSHQKTLDKYLAGQLKESSFLKRIEFKKHWYFDLWGNFRPILEFARYHRIPVFGIESSKFQDKGLKVRDEQSGEIIAKIISDNPQSKLIVFVGDLHIAPQHLPREVDKALAKRQIKRKRLLIYQNSESIYWKLAEQRREEQVEIVRVSHESYCLMNTPPIVWQQTFLNWLENEGEAIDYVDAKHTLTELLERVADFLEIRLPKDYDEFEVFTCGDLSFLEALRKDGTFTPRELKVIKNQILSSESYFIPRKRFIYLANVSINHAAEEVTHYLKYLCSGAEFERSLSDAFYVNTLHEAIGFFGSKIINHKRKCVHERQLKDLLGYLSAIHLPGSRRFELEIASLVLEHKKLERRKNPLPYQEAIPHRTEVFLGATHMLGYMLGDRLYHALVSGVINKKDINSLMTSPMAEEGEPFLVYIDLVRRTRQVKLPRRL